MKRIRKKLMAGVLMLAIALTASNAYTSATEIRGIGYKTYNIKGQPILFEDDLVKRKELRKKVAEWITIDLRDLDLILPEKARDSIRHVAIWIDYTTEEMEDMSNVGAVYYQNERWLLRVGWQPSKTDSIEIFNAMTYINLRGLNAGRMVLHELSHAYEYQVISDKERNELIKVYHSAKLSGRYAAVDYKGSLEKFPAYAMTNYHEYFAELTEAYYGENDYYPHNREQLKRHDPVGYAIVEKLWNR